MIRFREVGDSVLGTALCATLKRTFPAAEVHYVLNASIAPLFEGHPAIDRVIAFAKTDNKPIGAYLRKIAATMWRGRYDVIVDIRSTVRTLLFSLMSPIRPDHILTMWRWPTRSPPVTSIRACVTCWRGAASCEKREVHPASRMDLAMSQRGGSATARLAACCRFLLLGAFLDGVFAL